MDHNRDVCYEIRRVVSRGTLPLLVGHRASESFQINLYSRGLAERQYHTCVFAAHSPSFCFHLSATSEGNRPEGCIIQTDGVLNGVCEFELEFSALSLFSGVKSAGVDNPVSFLHPLPHSESEILVIDIQSLVIVTAASGLYELIYLF
jgi:hypothetical protein